MNYLLLSSTSSNYVGEEIAVLLAALALYMVPIIICSVIAVVFAIFSVIVNWKLFTKAGLEGWKAIIPYYNCFCLFDICMNKKSRNVCFIVLIAASVATPILMWIPILGWIVCPLAIAAPIYLLNFAIPKVFGKDTVMCVLDLFFSPVIYAILAFGNSTYDASLKLELFKD